MMISQPAIICLEAHWNRLLHRHDVSERIEAPASGAARDDTANAASDVAIAATDESLPAQKQRRVGGESAPTGPLTTAERRARAAALRGLALSRARRFDAAGAAFAEAAKLDPRLDLTRTPAFWKLERAAHEAAIAAYVTVGRDRDAAVLRAQVRSTFRPKALRSRSEPLPNS
ncbi:MAG: hypothetical protein M3Q50_01365 [Chloroflexota bacterium]|nr:hypothetical protein [Chloroflexia bacterium]MDQ3225267.1 hypothetical protein [Chloroflexota bacterium]